MVVAAGLPRDAGHPASRMGENAPTRDTLGVVMYPSRASLHPTSRDALDRVSTPAVAWMWVLKSRGEGTAVREEGVGGCKWR